MSSGRLLHRVRCQCRLIRENPLLEFLRRALGPRHDHRGRGLARRVVIVRRARVALRLERVVFDDVADLAAGEIFAEDRLVPLVGLAAGRAHVVAELHDQHFRAIVGNGQTPLSAARPTTSRSRRAADRSAADTPAPAPTAALFVRETTRSPAAMPAMSSNTIASATGLSRAYADRRRARRGQRVRGRSTRRRTQ